MKSSIPKGYKQTMKELGLKRNPFPIEAPNSVDHWADFKKLFDKLLEVHLQALLNPSPRIYVYWGHLGTGKTHACRYFCNVKTQKKLVESVQKRGSIGKVKCVSAAAQIPGKTGQLVYHVYLQILSRLLDEMTKEDFKDLSNITGDAGPSCVMALNSLARGITEQTQLSGPFFGLMKNTEEYRFLTLGRTRKYGTLETTSDLSLVIERILKAILRSYRVFIWVDELEDLRESNLVERRLFSDFIRSVYDEIDYGLTIILNFSCDTFDEVERLLLPAVWSRIRKEDTQEGVIEFQLLKDDGDLREYLLSSLRFGRGADPSEIIEKETRRKHSGDHEKGGRQEWNITKRFQQKNAGVVV